MKKIEKHYEAIYDCEECGKADVDNYDDINDRYLCNECALEKEGEQ